MSDHEEEWREVIGHESAYEVSSLGRVRSIARVIRSTCRGVAYSKRHRGKELSLAVNSDGYLAGVMCLDGVRKNFELHALVCRAFHGEPKAGQQVAHRDGIRTNCRADNLRWVSPAENMEDRARHGRNPEGVRNGRAILTEADVLSIRSSGASQRALARKYGVSRGAITGIISGRRWRCLT